MKNNFIKSVLIAGCFFFSVGINAQEKKEEASKLDPNVYGNGLTVKLNESGTKYVRFIMWHQFWLSNSSTAPGLSFSIRRSRVLALTQFTPRFLVLTHFGLNSLSAAGIQANPSTGTSNGSDMFLHDAWGEFAVKQTKLHIGAGLHYFNGFNRLSNQSTLNFMTMDNPGAGLADARLFNWADITTNNQFARNLGVYAKGTIGKFSYRASANNARKNIGSLSATMPSYQVAGTGKDWVYTAYANINLFENESDKLPYFVGSYLGKKKVLSIGTGFTTQTNALRTGSLNSDGIANYTGTAQGVSRVSADIFYDAPVGTQGAAVNLYGMIMNSKYGSNEGFNSGGLVPGSGTIIFGQAGYMFPSSTDNKIMPYVTYSNQNIKSTPNTSYELGIGANWFISGHNAKITAEYNTGKKGTLNAVNNNLTRIQLHVFI